jgi:hypothetical protein
MEKQQTFLCQPNYSKLKENAIYSVESNSYQTFMNAYYIFHNKRVKYGATKDEIVRQGNMRWKSIKKYSEEQLVLYFSLLNLRINALRR